MAQSERQQNGCVSESRDENQVFAEYSAENDPRVKLALEEELCKLLKSHAQSVIWLMLRENRPDIANDAVWRALHNQNKFRQEAKFSTWFQTIVKNLVWTTLARRSRKNEVPLEDLGTDPSSAIIAAVDVEKLKKGLSQEEIALLDFKMDNDGETEIAEKLGLTTAGVRTRWLRLRRKLLARL